MFPVPDVKVVTLSVPSVIVDAVNVPGKCIKYSCGYRNITIPEPPAADEPEL